MDTYYGTVRYFNESRGFGFIRQKNNEDIYFHCSELDGKPGERSIEVGTLVEFEIGPHRGSLVAKNVRPFVVEEPIRATQTPPSEVLGAVREQQ